MVNLTRWCSVLLVCLVVTSTLLLSSWSSVTDVDDGVSHYLAHMETASNVFTLVANTTTSATPMLPQNTTTAAEIMAEMFRELCNWSENTEVRHYDFDKRERLIDLLANVVEASPPPHTLSVRKRPGVFTDALCKRSEWSPDLLSGMRKSTSPKMVDVSSGLGGGAELDYLELRLYELNEIVDLFVVAESAYNFRGDRKPRLFHRNRDRFADFLGKILYLDLDTCSSYLDHVMAFRGKPAAAREQNLWDIQYSQRNCIWKMLLEARPDLPDDTLMIHTDIDEVPDADAMWAAKHCEWIATSVEYHMMIQLHFRPITYNLRTLLAGGYEHGSDAWKQGIVVVLGRVRIREDVRTGRYDAKILVQCLRCANTRVMRYAGVHLQAITQLASYYYKGIQHGEGGNIPNPILKLSEGPTTFCNAARPDAVEAAQQALQDAPGAWSGKSTSLLPREPPAPVEQKKWQVPWVLAHNPHRYPFFWGRGRLGDLLVRKPLG